MKHRLERRYGLGHLHFITRSCYRRKPLLGTERARGVFLKILAEVREREGNVASPGRCRRRPSLLPPELCYNQPNFVKRNL